MLRVTFDRQKLREARLRRGLTQVELSKASGVVERTVRNAERGDRVRLLFANYIVTALAVPLESVVLSTSVGDRAFRLPLGTRDCGQQLRCALESYIVQGDSAELAGLLADDVVGYYRSAAMPQGHQQVTGRAEVCTLLESTTAVMRRFERRELQVDRLYGDAALIVLSGRFTMGNARGAGATYWCQVVGEISQGLVRGFDMATSLTTIC